MLRSAAAGRSGLSGCQRERVTMDASALQAVLERGEDSRHQFKADFTNVDSLASELTVLANCADRRLFNGVTDDGHIVGLNLPGVDQLNQLSSGAASQRMCSRSPPPATTVQIEPGRVIVVDEPEGINKPYVDCHKFVSRDIGFNPLYRKGAEII